MYVNAPYILSSSQTVQRIISEFLIDREYGVSPRNGYGATIFTPKDGATL